jgi:hypothetical protein
MPAALILVLSPILHPIAARAGDVLAWYPARSIVALRNVNGRWRAIRRLPFDNAGALAGLMADEAIQPFSDEDAALLHPLFPIPLRPRPPELVDVHA